MPAIPPMVVPALKLILAFVVSQQITCRFVPDSTEGRLKTIVTPSEHLPAIGTLDRERTVAF